MNHPKCKIMGKVEMSIEEEGYTVVTQVCPICGEEAWALYSEDGAGGEGDSYHCSHLKPTEVIGEWETVL